MESLNQFWNSIIENYKEKMEYNNPYWKLYKELIECFFDQLLVKYKRSEAVAGEAAGVVTG